MYHRILKMNYLILLILVYPTKLLFNNAQYNNSFSI